MASTSTSGIGFGTLNTTDGTARLSGASSGIDTDALVKALTDAKRLPADRLESRITANEAKTKAFDELRTLLSAVQTATASLRNPPGYFGANDNVFETKEAYYSSDTTTSPASLLAVTPSASADTGTHEIVVRQLATARKPMGGAVADASADLAALNGGNAFSGTFTIGLAGGGTAPIAVDSTMSLQDVRAAINNVSATTGVTASVVQVSSTESRLMLSADSTGKEVTLAAASGDNVMKILGLSSDGGATLDHPVQDPLPAKLDIDGLPVERSTNQITDAIDGLTLDLYHADPGTKVTVEIDRSVSGIKDKIGALVTALNNLQDFVARNNVVDDSGQVNSDAVLFGDSTLRSIDQTVSNTVTGAVGGLSANASASLGALGIKLDQSNHFVVDDATLDAKLSGDLDSVRDVFEFHYTSSSPDLQLFARTGASSDSSFKVAIVDANGDGKAESATIDGVAVDVQGNLLVGRSGTPYEGLQLMWSGHGSTNVDVTATRGVGEQLYTALDGILDNSKGQLAAATNSLASDNSRYQTDITAIDQRVEDYRNTLIERFAAMESALSMGKALLQQVQTTTDAMFAKS